MTHRLNFRLARVEAALVRMNHGVPRGAADAKDPRPWSNLVGLIEAGRFDARAPKLRPAWLDFRDLAARVVLREGGPPAPVLPGHARRVPVWVLLHSADPEAGQATLRMINLLRLAVGGQAER